MFCFALLPKSFALNFGTKHSLLVLECGSQVLENLCSFSSADFIPYTRYTMYFMKSALEKIVKVHSVVILWEQFTYPCHYVTLVLKASFYRTTGKNFCVMKTMQILRSGIVETTISITPF